MPGVRQREREREREKETHLDECIVCTHDSSLRASPTTAQCQWHPHSLDSLNSPASTSQILGSSVLLTGGRISKSHSRPLVGRSALTPELKLIKRRTVQHLNTLPISNPQYAEHIFHMHTTCPPVSHHSLFQSLSDPTNIPTFSKDAVGHSLS